MKIQCRRVIFYSQGDEDAFLHFANQIPAVRKVEGLGDSIYLHLRPKVSEVSLRDLIALLFRYKVDMQQLAALQTDKNAEWFCAPQMYWHKKVFPKKTPRPAAAQEMR